ncbi:MAG TPA: ABC transporter ATP-binding protein [Acidimicrobiales bacterium]
MTATAVAGAAQKTGASLQIRGLCIDVRRYGEWVRVVDDVSLDIAPGQTLGLVGESGSGKSLTASSILRLLPPSVRVAAGSIMLDDIDVLSLSNRRLASVRGPVAAMVFQDPQNGLNPAFTIGNQLIETIRAHEDISRNDARDKAAMLLERVGISHPRDRLGDYPHQFSGGMAQRVMIALAIASSPRLLIADEPTTALDVTVQAQILRLLRRLQEEDGMSLLLISHDLSVIAEMADRVAVMYAGQIVESGAVDDVFLRPSHPYTDALLGAQPGSHISGDRLVAIPGTVPDPSAMPQGCRFHTRCTHAIDACTERPVELLARAAGTSARCIRDGLPLAGVHRAATVTVREAHAVSARNHDVLLELEGLTKEYPVGAGVFGKSKRVIRAVDDVTFDVRRGESVGVVGESGAGKSTVGRLVLGLTEPTRGAVRFEGRDLSTLSKAELREHRRHVQVVFQNPFASLDPLMTVADVVAEPIDVHRALTNGAREERIVELLAQVGLDESYRYRYPHQLSGGQRQRVAIARALALRPKLIVCDEPVSALDVSTQAQVINLLQDLQRSIEVAYLFVGHDLEVVRHVADRVAVMYLGRVVEWGPSDEVYDNPRHPYTRALLGSVLSVDPTARRLGRDSSDERASGAGNPDGGCPFAARCPDATEQCRTVDPPTVTVGEVAVRCHLY